MRELINTVEELLAETSIPSIAVEIFSENNVEFSYSSGVSDTQSRRPVRQTQVYDLASLTKVLVGGSVIATILSEEPNFLSRPVCDFVRDVDPEINIGHLLNHSSGYPAHIHFYTSFPRETWGTTDTREAIFKLARTTPLQARPGTKHCYSDLGFIVLCQVLESVDKCSLDQIFAERVTKPLNIVDLSWGHPQAAATERCPIRNEIVRGTVHDLNCAAMGGVSAHAGLFGTTKAVTELAKATLGLRDLSLPQTSVKTLFNYSGPGSHRGCWDSISPGYTSTGSHFPSDSVGHLGYTGTSLWMSPSRQAGVTVLTNRVHPNDDLSAIRAARPRIHDSVALALGWDRQRAQQEAPI